MYFRYFVIISPCNRAGPFIWTNLNPLHPRIFCAKFGWNWPSGSWEEVENRKSLQTDGQTDRRTDRQTTDERRSEKLTWAFSSGELKMKLCNSIDVWWSMIFTHRSFYTMVHEYWHGRARVEILARFALDQSMLERVPWDIWRMHELQHQPFKPTGSH